MSYAIRRREGGGFTEEGDDGGYAHVCSRRDIYDPANWDLSAAEPHPGFDAPVPRTGLARLRKAMAAGRSV